MRKSRISWGVLLVSMVLMLAGCGHKLVAHNGETTVSVYASREQFDKVHSMKSEGGAAGMLGGIGESILAKKVDANTPVKIISSDNQAAMIEVLDGPNKGFQGYVAKDDVD